MPWRRSSDIYAIWVSEVMLQQTQVVKVLQYYAKFLKVFPDVRALAAAEIDAVLKVWEGLGYYARARNLHKAAKFIGEQYHGKFPHDYKTLLKIPGIGEYTAAAVSSIAGGEKRAVVDGNVVRVICRLFKIQDSPKQVAVKKKIQTRAQSILSPARPGDYNQAIMELGATVCTPRQPKCLICPVSSLCRAQQTMENPSELPVKMKTKTVPHRNIAVAVLWDEGQIFIVKRKENGILGGMWDFPSACFQADETPQRVLETILKNDFGFTSETSDFLLEVKHSFTHYKMTMHVYHCLYQEGEPAFNAAEDWCWVKPGELKFYPFAVVGKKIIKEIENEFVAPEINR